LDGTDGIFLLRLPSKNALKFWIIGTGKKFLPTILKNTYPPLVFEKKNFLGVNSNI